MVTTITDKPNEVADLADASARIAQNKGRIKAKTQAFARDIKLRQLRQQDTSVK